MSHECGAACACRMDLDAALVAVEASTRLLASTLNITQSLDLIDKRYADLRAAQAKFKGAISAYMDHLRECRSSVIELPIAVQTR